ncbi:MAG: phage terminase large subunit [Leptospiraceae bacterium]|nr:phage terminase large subunit [Leptospiraceae bacterium]
MVDKINYNPKQLEGLKLLSNKLKKFFKFWGGSRSGKTFLIIRAIRIRCHKYPGSKHLVARYSFANAKKTIWLQTMLPEFRKDERIGLCKINLAEGIIRYKNGSVVMLGGLEPSRIDSILGAEYATIFISEANENKFIDIENLFSRLNDTSTDHKGNPIHCFFICDLNPTVVSSWTYQVFIKGINPNDGKPINNFHLFTNLWFTPYDNEENLSSGYIQQNLESLSSSKRKRFLEGQYGSFEGLVFPFEENRHIVDDFEIPKNWKRIRSIDFGYVHPFVCLWVAYDESNECAYIYREYVVSRQTVRTHAMEILRLSEGEEISDTICDHDAEDRATLEENGILNIPANKDVLAGLDHVIDLFENPKTKIKIFRSCIELRNSLESYRWKNPDVATKKGKDREVVKEDDDPADALRYAMMELFPIVNVDYGLDKRYQGGVFF